MHRRFVLNRLVDHTGVSGTGVVAEGVCFTDGSAVIRWLGGFPSTVVHFDKMEGVRAIHGHNGSTEIAWLDEEEN